MNTLYSFSRVSRVCSRSTSLSLWSRYSSTVGGRKLKAINEDAAPISNRQKNKVPLSGEERERILVAVKQVVAERDAARRAVENKEKAKMKYAQTIKDIEKITGAPVPPAEPKTYKVVKAHDRRRKRQQFINEILVSKFHKHTPIEEVKLFLEALGLHPKRIELEPKAKAQYLNAFITLPDDEIANALSRTRMYFKYGKKIVYFLSSPRANQEHKAQSKEKREQKEIAKERKKVHARATNLLAARELLGKLAQ